MAAIVTGAGVDITLASEVEAGMTGGETEMTGGTNVETPIAMEVGMTVKEKVIMTEKVEVIMTEKEGMIMIVRGRAVMTVKEPVMLTAREMITERELIMIPNSQVGHPMFYHNVQPDRKVK